MDAILILILILILWFVLSIVAGYMAEGKGRSGLGVTFLSFLLSPIVGLAVAVCMTPNTTQLAKQQIAAGKGKRCPFCAEIIKPAATVCRYCQREQPTPAASQP